MSNDDSRPDGGQLEDAQIFGQVGEVSNIEISPAERINRLLDMYFYAPMRVAWNDWRARIGGMLTLFFVLMGTVGISIVSEPRYNEGPRYVSPFADMSYPLGTDGVGQSIGRQIVHATPAMLQMALAGVVFSAGLAVIIGIVAGYKGGSIDRMLMTFTDIVLTLPGLPLIVVLAAIYPPRDPFVVGVIVAIDSWPGLARQLRSQVMTLREESYVEASRAMGMPTSTILNRDIIPQMAPYILINSAGAAAGVIGTSVALYFLGILPFTTFNWGVMMNLAYESGNALANPSRAGHWLFFPMITLSGFTFGLILLSQGLDRVFNPKLRARHAKTVVDEDEEGEDASSSITPMQ